jgi:hypothetical protein
MTALDVYVGQTDNREAVVLRGVVIAPGPTFLSKVLDWLHDGQATGIWSPRYADVLADGRALRPLLERINSIELPRQRMDDNGAMEAFRSSLKDESRYWVKAIEY